MVHMSNSILPFSEANFGHSRSRETGSQLKALTLTGWLACVVGRAR